MSQNSKLLPLIVFSQFAGTSVWFAGNAIIKDIQPASSNGFANITSIVQLGFIAGTLVFSLLTIADRFAAPKVFFFSSLVAATANILLLWLAKDLTLLFILRFVTGFFLAGIYPVGMKIAADCFPGKLGNALGFLVGALVLGTAFPQVLKFQSDHFNWQAVIVITSFLAVIGGLLVLLFVPPYKKTQVAKINLSTAFNVFRKKDFRGAAFGYFGHMWELYALWTFVPAIIEMYNKDGAELSIPLWTFWIIAAGGFGCIAGGMISRKAGSKNIAFCSLLISGVCCLCAPFVPGFPPGIFLSFMIIWGVFVAADSPQFSTLVASFAPADNKGTALTIVTSIGFSITIVSIQVLRSVIETWKEYGILILVLGPVFGLISMRRIKDPQ
jgi:MFS family permease